MTVRRFLAVTLAICAAPAAQSRSAPQAEVRWIPERPPQGSLVLVETGAEALGTLADEPLHFERVGARYRALAAIPLAADDTVRGTLTVAGVTQPLAIPVAQRDAPNERLRTADRFTRPPDAALRGVVPPTPRAGGRLGPNPCGHARADGRRSGGCRPAAPAERSPGR